MDDLGRWESVVSRDIGAVRESQIRLEATLNNVEKSVGRINGSLAETIGRTTAIEAKCAAHMSMLPGICEDIHNTDLRCNVELNELAERIEETRNLIEGQVRWRNRIDGGWSIIVIVSIIVMGLIGPLIQAKIAEALK